MKTLRDLIPSGAEVTARAVGAKVERLDETGPNGGKLFRIPVFHKGTNPTIEGKVGARRPGLEVTADDWAAVEAVFASQKNPLPVDIEHSLIDPNVPPKHRVSFGNVLRFETREDRYDAIAEIMDEEVVALIESGKKSNASPVYWKKMIEGVEHPLGLHSIALTSAASIDELPLVAAASIIANQALEISNRTEEEKMDQEAIDKVKAEQEKLAADLKAATESKADKSVLDSLLAKVEELGKTVAAFVAEKATETKKAADAVFDGALAEARSQGRIRAEKDEAENVELAARTIYEKNGIDATKKFLKGLPVIAPPDGKSKLPTGTPAVRSALDTIGPVTARNSALKPEHLARHEAILAYAETQKAGGRTIDYVTALREYGTFERENGAV
jgi:hypothetical protein